MQEVVYLKGPRISEDGINFDADIQAVHPTIQYRNIRDSVSDGSLGPTGYEAGQQNKDGGQV